MGEPNNRIRGRLVEIAKVLDVPLAILSGADESDGSRPSPDQIARLIQVFVAITDPRARRRILAAVENEAHAGSGRRATREENRDGA